MPSPLPPRAPGVPLLGNAMSMKGDARAFLVSQYRTLGPIFRAETSVCPVWTHAAASTGSSACACTR